MNIILLIVVGAICMALGRGLASLPWIWAVMIFAIPVGLAFLINQVMVAANRRMRLNPGLMSFRERMKWRQRWQERLEWALVVCLIIFVMWLCTVWAEGSAELEMVRVLRNA